LAATWLVGLDLGGGSFRCAFLDAESGEVVLASRRWAGEPDPEAPLGSRFDPQRAWTLLAECTREAGQRAGARPDEIRGIACSGIRHASVLVDAGGEVLFATTNQDARGAGAMLALDTTTCESLLARTGHEVLSPEHDVLHAVPEIVLEVAPRLEVPHRDEVVHRPVLGLHLDLPVRRLAGIAVAQFVDHVPEVLLRVAQRHRELRRLLRKALEQDARPVLQVLLDPPGRLRARVGPREPAVPVRGRETRLDPAIQELTRRRIVVSQFSRQRISPGIEVSLEEIERKRLELLKKQIEQAFSGWKSGKLNTVLRRKTASRRFFICDWMKPISN